MVEGRDLKRLNLVWFSQVKERERPIYLIEGKRESVCVYAKWVFNIEDRDRENAGVDQREIKNAETKRWDERNREKEKGEG